MPDVRTALITGASSGIGRCITERLLAANWRVIGIGRHFDHVAADPACFQAVVLDLSELDRLPQQLTQLAHEHAAVDTVILSAGRGRFGSLEEFSYAEIRALIDLNFTSQAYVARAFLPLMKRRRRGDLLVIGSEAALKGSRKGAVYCASKFALRGLAQALREECAKSGVRVTLINPGMVATPFFDRLDFAPGEEPEQHLLAEDVAATVLSVLESRPECVFDEINLSPRHHVIRFKPK